MTLQLYVANSNKDWDEHHALAVVAESREEAIAMIDEQFDGFTDYRVDVFPIAPGLKIVGQGYDSVDLRIELPPKDEDDESV